jgi:hypothetical protein
MKFKEDRPFGTPEAAEKKLLELANAGRPITPVNFGRDHQSVATLRDAAQYIIKLPKAARPLFWAPD